MSSTAMYLAVRGGSGSGEYLLYDSSKISRVLLLIIRAITRLQLTSRELPSELTPSTMFSVVVFDTPSVLM